MPFLIVLAALLITVLAAIALMPLALLQRYRAAKARRLARGWIAGLNLAAVAVSTGIFLVGAAVTAIWVPDAFSYSLAGLSAGALLGLLGLSWTRWEPSPRSLHYTPNRWLILTITLIVAARVFYGFWRAWQTWRVSPDDTVWIVTAGVAGSLAAGAVVLGYYLVYWAGVRRRIAQHNRARAGIDAANRARRVAGRRL